MLFAAVFRGHGTTPTLSATAPPFALKKPPTTAAALQSLALTGSISLYHLTGRRLLTLIDAKFYPAKGRDFWRVVLPSMPPKFPTESRKAWKHTEEGFSTTARECSFPFYEWLCIFGTRKPPRAYCSYDRIHFTVFYYAGEWRVFFWPLRGESER